MCAVYEHLKMLGLPVKDRVTGFSGVVTGMSFDLYGCIQAVVTPPSNGEEVKFGNWFDVTRLEITKNKPVMERPNFDRGYVAEGRKGAAPKPPL